MVECSMAWILLLVGIATREAEWFIASGVFAVAYQLQELRGGEKYG